MYIIYSILNPNSQLTILLILFKTDADFVDYVTITDSSLVCKTNSNDSHSGGNLTLTLTLTLTRTRPFTLILTLTLI